jgi:hypothetical protein
MCGARCMNETLCGRAAWYVLIGLGLGVGCQPSERPPAAEETVLTEPRLAEVGVGQAGRSLRDEQGLGGVVAQPASAYFQTRERIAFQIQIPQAVQLYQAEHGRLPASHDEFMQRIVEANRINLPQLPPGQVYRYHPEDGQLWVHPDAGQP